jgi:hypothetical protein
MTDITLPVFVFGSMIGLLVGAFFHLIAGGKIIRLIFCLIFGLIGFWSGSYISQRFGFQFITLGPLSYGSAIFFSIIFSAGGYWISGENKTEEG